MHNKIAGVASLCLILFTSGVHAHGGGATNRNTTAQDSHQKSDTQVALGYYREGLKYLQTASSFEQQSVRSGSDKKRAKYLKKANKQYGKAKRKFTKAIEYEPQLYQAHSRLGYARHQTGDYEAALTSYDIALGSKPKNAQIIGDRARSHLALGRLTETQSAYEILRKFDRREAADLMQEMLAWQSASPGDKSVPSDETIAQFDRWIVERQTP